MCLFYCRKEDVLSYMGFAVFYSATREHGLYSSWRESTQGMHVGNHICLLLTGAHLGAASAALSCSAAICSHKYEACTFHHEETLSVCFFSCWYIKISFVSKHIIRERSIVSIIPCIIVFLDHCVGKTP